MSDQPKVYVGDDGAVYEAQVDERYAEKVMSPEMLAFIKALIKEAVKAALDEKETKP